MTYELTLAAVKKHSPCKEDFARVAGLLPKRRKINAAQARELGCTYDDVIWIASAVAMDDEALARRLTAYVNDCAKAVLHIWEQKWPEDDRPRKAIEACGAFLDGTGSEAEWRAAAGAAWGAWAARDAWDAWAAFHNWQFDRLIYWLTEEAPKPLPMPEKGVSLLENITSGEQP